MKIAMLLLKNFLQGNCSLLKTFLLGHLALVVFIIGAETISKFLPQQGGEFDDTYTPLYFIAVLELLAMYLLISFWNAIKKYKGSKVWLNLSKLYAFFVVQCILLPFYISAYLIYLSEPIK
jgi:hypothetical protein